MMHIKINGVLESLSDETTINDIIKNKNYKNVVIWLNEEKLLRQNYDKKTLKNGDIIKIVRVLGGG